MSGSTTPTSPDAYIAEGANILGSAVLAAMLGRLADQDLIKYSDIPTIAQALVANVTLFNFVIDKTYDWTDDLQRILLANRIV